MNLRHALSARSHFSLGEGMLSPGDLVDRAKELGYESVALVDTMSINGLVDFTNKAQKAGIKPIIGCRLRIVPDPHLFEKSKTNQPIYPKVYVKSEAGLKALMGMLTLAYSESRFYYVPRLGLDDLKDGLEKSEGGLIFTSGDFYAIQHSELCDDMLDIARHALTSAQTFAEVVPINTPLFDTINEQALDMAWRHGLPLVASYPVLYEKDEDAATLEVLGAITSNMKMGDGWRPQQFIKDFSLGAPQKLAERIIGLKARLERFGEVEKPGVYMKQALENVAVLADMVEYVWDKQPVSLPSMAPDEYAALVQECKKGWMQRLAKPTLGYKPSAAQIPEYKERLKFELGVLKKMGFERYFLVVQELVQWSKKNGIMVGPGRGSVGGSLVAYLMGITDVDPIRFGLLFERFINPSRIDLPDADLDFMSSRRHEVIGHLVDTYGQDRVAGISNYGTLASASALRDAGRVHELDRSELECTKYVPKEHGKPVSLDTAAEQVSQIAEFRAKHGDLWHHATRLEGVLRSLGQHAAGIIVGGVPLVERSVVMHRKSDELPVVNWDKRVVEDWGLVKMDILGLTTLDVLAVARNMIKERHGEEIDYTALPLDDPEVLDAFGRGDTVGVFQFESSGMRKLLRDLAHGGRLRFEDLAAATSLYRPGPMDSGLMDDYVAIKQGLKEPFYEHPNMQAALEETSGVIIYQEQVMRIASDVAGFSLAEADHLRKAMGKKDKEKMAAMREQWIEGCAKTSGFSAKNAGALFDKIEAFAGYGFNKSHAVEYSIISYLTMWVKVKYPAEFYAANLGVMKEDKLPGIVADAEARGIYVVPPDINRSGSEFVIDYDADREQHVLIAPFSRLKGLSEKTAAAILAARDKLEPQIEIVFDDGSVGHYSPNKVCKTLEDGRNRTLLEIIKASLTPVL